MDPFLLLLMWSHSSENIYSYTELGSVNCPISCNKKTCKIKFQHLNKYFHYLNHMQQGFFFSFFTPYNTKHFCKHMHKITIILFTVQNAYCIFWNEWNYLHDEIIYTAALN